MSIDFETKTLPGQLSVDEAEGIVECFVAGVGNKDSVGDIVLPGAFDGSLKRRRPRVVWGHNWNEPIGKVLEIYEVGPNDPRLPQKMRDARIGGLFAKVQFNLKSERGREAFANIVFFGAEQEWSIGYKTIQAVYDNTRQANLLREVELYEVSPVLHGANQLTGTISVKTEKQEDRITSFKKSQWPMFDRRFAEMIKEEHPEIWDAGGNIKGDDQYTILSRIADQGGSADTEDQIKALELREAWIARHEKNFKLPGIIAQIKWLAVGSRGEGHMKDVVREAIDSRTEGKGYDWKPSSGEDREDLVEMWQKLQGYAASRRERSSDDDPIEELEEMAEEAEKPGKEILALAIANEVRSPVRVRTITGNTVVFDVMDDDEDVMTMRSSWHAEDDEIMIGKPERVRVETVYLPVAGGEGEAYLDDERMKIDPRAGIPQERFTGDVLRGYGPRRGNLERLLRYWRPIMRKPGGFRRCLVILANHPELYPLQNICAWLHHETTGLWPNEGCHHPGMKNCRRKLRGVVRGSIWSNDNFDDRMRKLRRRSTDGKSMEEEFEVTDDDVKFANKVLNEFLAEEKEFAKYLGDENNWEHVGDDDEGNEKVHGWVKPDEEGKSPCGCAKSEDASEMLPKTIEESLAELEEKVGRSVNSGNAKRITEAIRLLSEVIGKPSPSIERKEDGIWVSAPVESLFHVKEALDSVIDYYHLDAEVSEKGVFISGDLVEVASEALTVAVDSFEDIRTKGLPARPIATVSEVGDGFVVISTLEDHHPEIKSVMEDLAEHFGYTLDEDGGDFLMKGAYAHHTAPFIESGLQESDIKGIGRALRRILPGGGRGGRGGMGRRGGRGGMGRRGGRGGGSGRGGSFSRDSSGRFNPNARDADGDGTIQDGTPFERPVAPNSPGQDSPEKPDSGPAKNSAKSNLKDWTDTSVAALYDDLVEDGKDDKKRDATQQELNRRFKERIYEALSGDGLDAASEALGDPKDEGPSEKLYREMLEKRKKFEESRGKWEEYEDLYPEIARAFDEGNAYQYDWDWEDIAEDVGGVLDAAEAEGQFRNVSRGDLLDERVEVVESTMGNPDIPAGDRKRYRDMLVELIEMHVNRDPLTDQPGYSKGVKGKSARRIGNAVGRAGRAAGRGGSEYWDRRGGSGGRGAGAVIRRVDRDDNARDADGDGWLQEGTTQARRVSDADKPTKPAPREDYGSDSLAVVRRAREIAKRRMEGTGGTGRENVVPARRTPNDKPASDRPRPLDGSGMRDVEAERMRMGLGAAAARILEDNDKPPPRRPRRDPQPRVFRGR